VPEFDIDVMIQGQNAQRGCLDGDTVLIKMRPACRWPDLKKSNEVEASEITKNEKMIVLTEENNENCTSVEKDQ
jgi:hypothetical protein